jgi:hypothetical protein
MNRAINLEDVPEFKMAKRPTADFPYRALPEKKKGEMSGFLGD